MKERVLRELILPHSYRNYANAHSPKVFQKDQIHIYDSQINLRFEEVESGTLVEFCFNISSSKTHSLVKISLIGFSSQTLFQSNDLGILIKRNCRVKEFIIWEQTLRNMI